MHPRDDGYRLIRVDLEDIAAIEIEFDETLVVDAHTHDDHTDSFLVLEGEVEFTAGDDTVVLGPGGFISSPPFTTVEGKIRISSLIGRVASMRAPRTTIPSSVSRTSPSAMYGSLI